ncbi:ABC transporter permease [Propioniciclava coleopterorum]|uniref:ABC transporter permease n=1 Tax=Propioniciclava coleopterorum TaxID=2714937 RepID=A0A6G7YAN4_9ACTN|nr:ABC transporter permease [Propioniciclava coleopterorum]QIK73698.1 ABC transporter permease [Propioniciclava coleopterorum]
MTARALGSRVGQAVLVLALAFTLAFILLQALPGDAVLIKFENPELGLSPEEIAAIRTSYGADVPWWQAYLHTLAGFLRGDFGFSIQNGAGVAGLLAEVLPQTVTLSVLAFAAAVVLAVTVALLATWARWTWLRNALASLPSVFVSVPTFWLAMVLIQIFSFRLGLVKVIGAGPVEALILPVLTIAVPISAPLAQILVRSIEDVQRQPFVSVVRARGASRWWVLTRNVARNALLPTLTIAGVLFGELVAGAVVTETVFGRAGIGRLTEQAVANQDVAVLQAIVVLSAAAFVTVNLLIDLLGPLVDPRLTKEVGLAA